MVSTVRHWDLKELPLFRQNLSAFHKLKSDDLRKWLQSVFEEGSQSDNYSPPMISNCAADVATNLTEVDCHQAASKNCQPNGQLNNGGQEQKVEVEQT